MTTRLRSHLACIAAALAAFVTAARAADTAPRNVLVGFAITSPVLASHRDTLATNGRELQSSSQVEVPFADKAGAIGKALFGRAVTLSADAQADGIHVSITYEEAKQIGKAPAVGAPPARAFKIHATAIVPTAGGEVTVHEGDASTGTLEVLRRENLEAGKFTIRILVTSAPPKH